MIAYNIIIIALYVYILGTFLSYSLKEYEKEEKAHQAFLKWYNNGGKIGKGDRRKERR